MTQELISELFRGQTELLTGMNAAKVAGWNVHLTGLMQRETRGTRHGLVGEFPATSNGCTKLQMDP